MLSYALSCSQPLSDIRKRSGWICKLSIYQEESGGYTAIFKDSRSLTTLRTFVSRSKKDCNCDILQIQEITEAEFIQREAVAASIVVTAPSSSSTHADARSRSPRPTLARHTPFEGVKELLPKLSKSESLAVLA